MKKTIRHIQNEALTFLRSSDVLSPAMDIRLLLLHVTGYTQEELLLKKDDILSHDHYQRFMELVNRRKEHEPVAKIIGEKEFYGRLFFTNSSTLDPRPDSETLIDVALKAIPSDKPCHILDLGTGTGCLIITLLAERPFATGIAIDVSEPALQIANRNAQRHNVADRLAFLQGSWLEPLQQENYKKDLFDLVISNPPYIAEMDREKLDADVKNFDPHEALFAGLDGFDAYRIIVPQIQKHIAQEGWVIMEHGKGQEEGLQKIFCESKLSQVTNYKDLSGNYRVMSGRVKSYA